MPRGPGPRTVGAVSTPRDVDADFLALPLDALADAALQVARDRRGDLRRRPGPAGPRDRGPGPRPRRRGHQRRHRAGPVRPGRPRRRVGLRRHRRPATPTPRPAPPPSRCAAPGSPARWCGARSSSPRSPCSAGRGCPPTRSTPSTCRPTSRAPCCWAGASRSSPPAPRHAEAESWCVKEQKFYADLDGSRTVQQRVRMHPGVTAVVVADDGRVDTVRSLAPPVGRGWEYLAGPGAPLRAGGPRPGRGRPREARRPVGRARPLRPRHRPQPAVADRSTSRSPTPPSSTGRWATRPPTPARRSPPPTSSAPAATAATS